MDTKTTWAGTHPAHAPISEWVERFNRDGFIFLEDVLPADWVAELNSDLMRELHANNEDGDGAIQLHHRMFETSTANLRLFDVEPIATFAETLVERECHVVHNNGFRSMTEGRGVTTWHQDNAPHYIVTHGDPPDNVRLPVLLFSCNYYLTDVTEGAHGPFQVVPGSHLFGAPCPPSLSGTKWEGDVVSCLGRAGSVAMFNNQAWHRGAPNTSDRVRAVTQVSYGRRMVNHFYYPFMNYQMPEHIFNHANPRLKRLLGFLPHGAYG